MPWTLVPPAEPLPMPPAAISGRPCVTLLPPRVAIDPAVGTTPVGGDKIPVTILPPSICATAGTTLSVAAEHALGRPGNAASACGGRDPGVGAAPAAAAAPSGRANSLDILHIALEAILQVA